MRAICPSPIAQRFASSSNASECVQRPLPSSGVCAPGLSCILPAGVDPGFYDGPGSCVAQRHAGESCNDRQPCLLAFECQAGLCQPTVDTLCGQVPVSR